MRRSAFLVAPLLLLGGCETLNLANARPFDCRIERDLGHARLEIIRQLRPDGVIRYSSASWHTPYLETSPYAFFAIYWSFGDPLSGPPPDAQVMIHFFGLGIPEHRRGHVELRPPGGVGDQSGAVLAGPVTPTSRLVITLRLDQLRALAGTAGAVRVLAIGEDGRTLAEDRVRLDLVDRARADTEAAVPEWQAMIADYRTRCETNEIVVV